MEDCLLSSEPVDDVIDCPLERLSDTHPRFFAWRKTGLAFLSRVARLVKAVAVGDPPSKAPSTSRDERVKDAQALRVTSSQCICGLNDDSSLQAGPGSSRPTASTTVPKTQQPVLNSIQRTSGSNCLAFTHIARHSNNSSTVICSRVYRACGRLRERAK
ncbi:hypothetical protein B0H17DRAFT_1137195 [Mycena rosella]|uniref:Uncharacterized protein n=1 Tax=Mycena rosella TaxID=1033263 RepID=A0AAD7GB36_MYCRO|nr:hypothetical protein B0H17DRAFT_1137195 [Mycena rosella]